MKANIAFDRAKIDYISAIGHFRRYFCGGLKETRLAVEHGAEISLALADFIPVRIRDDENVTCIADAIRQLEKLGVFVTPKGAASRENCYVF